MRREVLQNKKGVTLIEIIILVVVVSIFIMGLIPLVTENMVLNRKSKIKMNAYQAANKVMEELKNSSYDSLQNSSASVPNVQGGNCTVTILKDIDGDGDDEEDIVKAKVVVSYPERNQTKTLTLTTLIAR